MLAVEGDQPAFRCMEIRQRGPARVPARDYSPMCGIAAAMQRPEKVWRAELQRTTVADISTIVARPAPQRAQAKTQAWLAQLTATCTPGQAPTGPWSGTGLRIRAFGGVLCVTVGRIPDLGCTREGRCGDWQGAIVELARHVGEPSSDGLGLGWTERLQ